MCGMMSKNLTWIVFVLCIIYADASKYFIGSRNFVNYTDAINVCLNDGGILAIIKNENDHINASSVCGSTDCWIGLHSMNNENNWEYIDGTSVNGEYGFDINGNPTVGITPWDKGQPDFSSNMEHCVHLAVFHNDRFNDRACWFNYLVALCMREDATDAPTLSPTLAPTFVPTITPSANPTTLPTTYPTLSPTLSPTILPTLLPTVSPTLFPTLLPTLSPTLSPALSPTILPTLGPTINIQSTSKTVNTNSGLISLKWSTILIVGLVSIACCIILIITAYIISTRIYIKNILKKPNELSSINNNSNSSSTNISNDKQPNDNNNNSNNRNDIENINVKDIEQPNVCTPDDIIRAFSNEYSNDESIKIEGHDTNGNQQIEGSNDVTL